MTQTRPYQVCLFAGTTPPAAEGVTYVDLTPAAPTAAAVLEALANSKLTPADLRARAVFAAGDDRDIALLIYSALIGFSGRRLDVAVGETLISAPDLDAAARQIADAGRPAEAIDHIQVGETPHETLPSIAFGNRLSTGEASAIRYARRVRLAPGAGTVTALTQLIVVAALRARGTNDRLPFLVNGDEPVEVDETGVVGICLDTLRRDAQDLRRSMRSGDRASLAPAVELSDRQRRLIDAAGISIEEALTRLGGRYNEETEFWHCPRPDRHANGDANASMRVVKGKVRCFRCDSERLDSLRLAMDVFSCSADEAADWLLDEAKPARELAVAA